MIIFAASRTVVSGTGWIYIIATIILHAFYFWFLGNAYEHGDLSLVYPLSRGFGPFLVPFLAALFIQEQLAPMGMFGIAVIICGIYFIHLRSFSFHSFLKPFLTMGGKASLWSFCTGVSIAAYSIVDKIGSPIEIYEKPANEFIAGFVGYVNFLEGSIKALTEKTNTLSVSTLYGMLEINRGQKGVKVGDSILLVIRPEAVSLSPSKGTERPNTFHGTVESQMYAGNLAKYTVKFGDKQMVVDHYNPMGSQKFSENEAVEVTLPRSMHFLKR